MRRHERHEEHDAISNGLAFERELQQRLLESGDAREGLTANLEKRAAKFAGR